MRYLSEFAQDDEMERRCKTYLVVNDEELQQGKLTIVAYFTISLSVFDASAFPEDVRDELLGSGVGRVSGRFVPAYLIAQIACSKDYEHSEFSGASLLDFAECVVAQASEITGGNIVYLHCCERLIPYYEGLRYMHMTSENDVDVPNFMVKFIDADIIQDELRGCNA